MNKELSKKEIENALSHFQIKGEVKSSEPYGSGHINDTFLVKADRDYILQRMNTNIFKNAKELMENVSMVCDFMEKEIVKAGGDPERTTPCAHKRGTRLLRRQRREFLPHVSLCREYQVL